jgi:rhodanese-related sulfurtransferase
MFFVLTVCVIVAASFAGATEEDTTLSPDVNEIEPLEAYELLIQDPENTFLVDCRSMAEYELLGHPPMAYNIPYKFWTSAGLEDNREFVNDVTEKFETTNRLLIICRSGKRSLDAAHALMETGFAHVLSVAGGFEGTKVKDENNADYGLRGLIDGWLFHGLPYTYDLDKTLHYPLHTSCGCE